VILASKLVAKPGSYVFDYEINRYVGRINKDGTEDRRWVQGGSCSFLNSLLETSNSYTPNDPQAFAETLLGTNSNGYIVRGYSLAISSYTLSPTEWVDKLKGFDCNPLSDLFKSLSRGEEFQAKSAALCTLLRKEVKRRDLEELAEVTKADQILAESQRQRIADSALELGFRWLASLHPSTVNRLILEEASDEMVVTAAAPRVTESAPGSYMGFKYIYSKADRTRFDNAKLALIKWASENTPLHKFIATEWVPPCSSVTPTLSQLCAYLYPYEYVGFYGQYAAQAARQALSDPLFLKNARWAEYQLAKAEGPLKEALRQYLNTIEIATIRDVLENIRFKKRGKGVTFMDDYLPCNVIRILTWSEFKEATARALPQEALDLDCPYNRSSK